MVGTTALRGGEDDRMAGAAWIRPMDWLLAAAGRLPLAYNPLAPQMRADPHAVYRRLREEQPVHRSPLMRGLVLSRYDDVAGVFHDSRFASGMEHSPMLAKQARKMEGTQMGRFSAEALLMRNPPDHGRLRRLVSRAFTPNAVAKLETAIADRAELLIDEALERGSLDVPNELGFPLAIHTIAEMLGVDPADSTMFQRWAVDLFALTDPSVAARKAPREAAEQSLGELREYFQFIAGRRYEQPRDDIISALVHAEVDGDRLTQSELLTTCGMLVVGGHETTQNLVGNGVLCLLRFPDERRRLADDPELLPTAVDEVIRYEGIVHLLMRVATFDTEIGGVPVRDGQMVLLLVAAANRDPAQFPDPDRFDVGRQPNVHLGFGHGAHFCLGSNLAKRETATAIGALLRRIPDFDGDAVAPRWKPNPMLRGLEELVVTW